MSDSESLSSDDEYYGDNGEEFRNSILNNNYALIERIGYGSYSSVWLSYSINDDEYYAIKIQNNEDYEIDADFHSVFWSRKFCHFLRNFFVSTSSVAQREK